MLLSSILFGDGIIMYVISSLVIANVIIPNIVVIVASRANAVVISVLCVLLLLVMVGLSDIVVRVIVI